MDYKMGGKCLSVIIRYYTKIFSVLGALKLKPKKEDKIFTNLDELPSLDPLLS